MIRPAALSTPLVIAAAGVATAEAWPAEAQTAPSGQDITLHEVLYEEQPYSGEMQVVVRLIAPAIAQESLQASSLREDMDWACRTWGLAAAGTLSSPPDVVVVQLMETPFERGQAMPGTRQLIETYRLEGPLCIWDFF
ncbi:MAG: DUF6497 family protein [Roseicyclus sp.]